MVEFIAGCLVTTYVLGLAFFVHDSRPTKGNVILYILWPLILLIGPNIRWALRRMQSDHLQSGGWRLKPGMSWDDSPRQVFVKWIKSCLHT